MDYFIGIIALLIAINGAYRMIKQFCCDLPSRWRIFSGALRIAGSAAIISIYSSHFSPIMVFFWLVAACVAIIIAEGYALIFTE